MKHKKHRSTKPHSHRYESEAKETLSGNKHTFFHGVQSNNPGVKQNVQVNVTVQKDDDCLTGCFSGLLKCFKPTPAG